MPDRQRPRQFFRQWREKNVGTQDRALERLPEDNWSQSKLSRIENGQIVWNAYDLADLEMAYGVSSWALLNVDPTKDGEVIDIMQIIKDKDTTQVLRVLKAL